MMNYFCETFGLYPQQLSLLFNLSAGKVRRFYLGLEREPLEYKKLMFEAIEHAEVHGLVPMLAPYIAQAHHDLAGETIRRMKRRRGLMDYQIEVLAERVKEQEARYAYDVRFLALCHWLEAHSTTDDPILKEYIELARRVTQRDLRETRFMLLYRKLLQKHYLEAEKRCMDEVLAILAEEQKD
jgi:hypothetical protein